MPVTLPAATGLVMPPEGSFEASVPWPLLVPVVSSKRPRAISEWSLLLKWGMNVRVCFVLKATLLLEPV